MKKTFFIILILTSVTISCKKNQDSTIPQHTVIKGEIKGNVVLPTGTIINVNSLSVLSAISTSQVQNANYAVSAYTSELTTLLVNNTGGKTLLMGYSNPADTNKNITTTSTALALVMNTPLVMSLSLEGKQNIIPQVLSNTNFASLEADVKTNLSLGKDLFDSNNTSLFNKVAALTQSLTTQSQSTTTIINTPIVFQQSGRDLTFANDGKKSYFSSVGVYKDGKRIDSFKIAGAPLFPGSIEDILKGEGRVFGNATNIKYSMSGDGQFNIKIRTGWIGANDHTVEYNEARFWNVRYLALNSLKLYFPLLDEDKLSCFGAVTTNIVNQYDAIINLNAKTAVFTAIKMTLDDSKNIIQCVTGSLTDYNSTFFKKISEYFKIADLAFVPANISNLFLFSLEWGLSKPAFDTCYLITGNNIAGCVSIRTGVTVAGGNGDGGALNQLSLPYNIFVDAAKAVYIVDGGNERVQKWQNGASVGVTVAGGHGPGLSANQFYVPIGLAVDALGNIYVSDNRGGVGAFARIQKWSSGANSGTTFLASGGNSSAANHFASASGIFLDASNNLYIVDEANDRVQKWMPGATLGITVAGGYGRGSASNQLNLPQDVFVDASGNVYVSDYYNNRVQKWSPGATSGTTVAGGHGPGSAANQFDGPNGIFVDASGNLFVSDEYNNRVQKWSLNSISGVTVAGGNGLGSNANQLYYPNDVFLDASGNIYVSDFNNERIQRWPPY